MQRIVLLGFFTALLLLASSASTVPQGERDLKAESISRGKTVYRIYCRNCHGKTGQGDGSIADLLKIPPTDLTRLTSKNGSFPTDLLYQVIDGRQEVKGHGQREMPIWGTVFQKPMVPQESKDTDPEAEVRKKILNLLSFIESIQVVDDNADRDE